MSESYTDMLRKNYSNMHTDILIETKIKGGLPNGQSLGKKLLSIKVINKTNATPCKLSESFIRNITTVIPFLALIDAVMIFGVKKQRMGDEMANTLVVNA